MKTSLLLACMLLLAAQANAQLTATQAYVRALPPGVANTSAYMILSNQSNNAVELLGGRTPVAEKVTLHSTMNHDGMMHMMPMAGLSIPAHGEAVLASGGHHLMLENLKETLTPGTEVELTLEFSGGIELNLQVTVRSVLDE